MDSLTQIVLGASVGEAVAGKKIGNKAMLWGAVAGTIPDLDVLLEPYLDMVAYLATHRGFSHSFTFAILCAPLFAWLLTRIYPQGKAGFRDWWLLFFLGFVTHYLLDAFTTWGTQLFSPFSSYRVAFYSIFVIDPLYTLPFLALLLIAAFYPRRSSRRRTLNYLGLSLSTLYLGVTVVNKQLANSAFEKGLAFKNISYESYISKPTPLNSVLWSITAQTEEGYVTAYYSLLDGEIPTEFTYLPGNHHLLEPWRGSPKLEKLIEITKGYYTVEKTEEGVVINDLRFGKFNSWTNNVPSEFVFRYQLTEQGGELLFEQNQFRFKPDGDYLMAFLGRIGGQKD